MAAPSATETPKGVKNPTQKVSPVPVPVIPDCPRPGKENAPAQGATSKKRKSTEAQLDLGLDTNLDDIDCSGHPMDLSCEQVRRKIRTWLDSGATTKGAFCDAIHVNPKSLNGFLALTGRDKGMNHAAYGAAWEFFKKREIAGLPMAKKAKTTAKKAAGAKGTAAAAAAVDISDVMLPGQEKDAVPIFDSCDEVRRKIDLHLGKPGVTQAQFCRDLLALFNGPEKPEKIQSAQLNRFRGTKGPAAGTKSPCFYAAYVFFEKMRIKEDKPKTKHRQEMEKAWPKGMDLSQDSRTGYGFIQCDSQIKLTLTLGTTGAVQVNFLISISTGA